MAETDSIDLTLRRRLLDANVNQKDLAKYMGRNRPWLNKVLGGAGHVTIDDWWSIAEYLNLSLTEFVKGAAPRPPHRASEPLTGSDLRVLRAFRRIPEGPMQTIGLDLIETYAKHSRRVPQLGSPARKRRTLPVIAGTDLDKRRGA